MNQAKAFWCIVLLAVMPWLRGATISEPIWRESIGGNPLCAPCIAPEAVIVNGDNKAVQAYHRSGRLLWRTYFKYKLTPLMAISERTFIYVTDVRGNLHALNRNGTTLWSLPLEQKLRFPPIFGKDGRLYLTYDTKIECLTFSGRRIWTQETTSPLCCPPVADSSTGGFFMAQKNGTLSAVSPFGTVTALIERADLPVIMLDTGSSVAVVSAGNISCYAQSANNEISTGNNGANNFERIWTASLSGTPVAGTCSGEKIGIITQNGTISLFESTTGVMEKHISLPFFSYRNSSPLLPVWIRCDGDKWYTGSPSGACAFDSSFTTLWMFQTAKNRSTPVVSAEGDIYTAGSDWILYAYRAESRIQDSAPLLLPDNASLGTAGVPSQSAGSFFCANSWNVTQSLQLIEQRLSSGSNHETEQEDTRRLGEIAADTCNDPYGNHPELSQRATACRLLGITGTEDARIVLCTVIDTEKDPVILREALRALGSIGFDFQGKTTASIKRLLAAATLKTDGNTVAAACEALSSIAKTMGSPVAEQCISAIMIVTHAPYGPQVQKKASEALQKLAQ